MATVSPPNEHAQLLVLDYKSLEGAPGPMQTMLVSLQMQRFSLVKIRMEFQRPLTRLLILWLGCMMQIIYRARALASGQVDQREFIAFVLYCILLSSNK
jgi:hypothetical protein